MYFNIYKVIRGNESLRISVQKQYKKCKLLCHQFSTNVEVTASNLINTKRNPIDIEREELIEAIEIERNFFGQSSIKYQPTSLAEVRQENRSQFALKPTQLKRKKHAVLPQADRTKRQAEPIVIDDKETGLKFTKLQLGDSRLHKLMITARSGKQRNKNNQIVIEGRRLIVEALKCNMQIQAIIFSKKEQLINIKGDIYAVAALKEIDIFKIPHHDLKLWSTLATPPGILAIFQKPQTEDIVNKLAKSSIQCLPVTIVCDNIREPNNLGGILRTCAALPCHQVVLTKGCCDPWETKVLRSGCGGHFRIPIYSGVKWCDVLDYIPKEYVNDCCVFIAENKIRDTSNDISVEYTNIGNIGSHNLLIIGGETHGVGNEAYQFIKNAHPKSKCLHIPITDGADSLNVVAALTLLLYELRKQIFNFQKTCYRNKYINI